MNKIAAMVIAIPVVIITVAFVIGISSALLSDKEDGQIEEIAEEIMESESEHLLGLDDNTFHFDLTPDSQELGPIAMEKIRETWCYENCYKKEMDE